MVARAGISLIPCPHCGGRLIWDKEDNEIRCINCGRPLNSDNHNREGEPMPEPPSQEVKTPQPSAPISEKPPKSPRVVPVKEWYAPWEITFHSNHILFILKHLELLREGVYPPDPYHSGYTDSPMPKKQKRTRHRAYFETPCQLAAEVERRLENCGLDGILPQLIYTYKWPEETVSKYYRISVDEVKFRAGAILWHISGRNYQARPYRRWHVSRDYGNQRKKQNAKQG